MNIRTRLKLTTWVFLGAIAVMLVLFIGSLRVISTAEKAIQLSDKMQQHVFERVLLRDEFIVFRGARAKTQWLEKSQALESLMDQAAQWFPSQSDQVLLQNARINLNTSIQIFLDVVHRLDQESITENDGTTISEPARILITQEYLKTYLMKNSIDRLSESAMQTAIHTRNRGVSMMFLLFSACTLSIIVNNWVLSKTITRRITALSQSAAIIGSGDLDFRIAIESNDELSELARLNNEMADNLKRSYTSVENLQKEVAARKQAEGEVKKMNAALEFRVQERTAQLQAANRELEMFSYSVSHDLRAPLRHLIGFAELLRKRAPDNFDDKIRHYLDVISASATEMSLLVDDLLSFSRMGRTEMGIVRVDFNKIVSDVLNTLQPEIHCRTITWNITPLPVVAGDMAMLRLVMMNLIANAVKFTRNKDAAEITISCTPGASGEYIFSVRDNGVGFDMKYIEKLFNLFQRLHRTEEFEGTGVGLANVRRIVKRHGGDTWAEGEVGKGAVFYFSMPAPTRLI